MFFYQSLFKTRVFNKYSIKNWYKHQEKESVWYDEDNKVGRCH